MNLQAISFIFVLIWDLRFTQKIPTSSSQFFVSNNDGSYKYGYNNGEEIGAEQISDPSNQVSGRYFYKNEMGENVEVKYTAGIQGFVPLGFEKTINPTTRQLEDSDNDSFIIEAAPEIFNDESVQNETTKNVSQDVSSDAEVHTSSNKTETTEIQEDSKNTVNSDRLYAFSYTTDDAFRQESADIHNTVHGKYSYKDATSVHDLTYTAGANTGFVVTGGSLASPNGLTHAQSSESVIFYTPSRNDGSYSFEFSTPTQSRHEISDNKGNVYGGYSFVNEEGSHDLRYVAGSATGFLPVGGSLVKSLKPKESSSSVKSTKTDVLEDSSYNIYKEDYKNINNNVNLKNEGKPYKTADVDEVITKIANYNSPVPLVMTDHLLLLLNNKNSKIFGYIYTL